MGSGSPSPVKTVSNTDWLDEIIEKLLSIRNKVPGPSCVIDLELEQIMKLIMYAQMIIKE